jgi:hypothetical protein
MPLPKPLAPDNDKIVIITAEEFGEGTGQYILDYNINNAFIVGTVILPEHSPIPYSIGIFITKNITEDVAEKTLRDFVKSPMHQGKVLCGWFPLNDIKETMIHPHYDNVGSVLGDIFCDLGLGDMFKLAYNNDEKLSALMAKM